MSEPRMRICPGCNATFGATEGHACATTVYAGQGAGHLAMSLLAQKAQECESLKSALAAAEREVERLTEERRRAGARADENLTALESMTHRALAAERARDEAVEDRMRLAREVVPRAMMAEQQRDEAVALLQEIVAEWEKDAEGAEECFPLLARARAVLEGGG